MTAVSLVIPAYNEERAIGSVVDQIINVMEKADITGEIIVVDDGSMDHINLLDETRFHSLFLSDEFAVRYVPQSRYFQSQEFDSRGLRFDEELLSELNTGREITVSRRIDLVRGTVHVEVPPGSREMIGSPS